MILLITLFIRRYKWMTFGEAATAREAIGSGLRYYGLEQVSCFEELGFPCFTVRLYPTVDLLGTY